MTQEFVTLPREVVEQALKVLEYAANDVLTGRNAATALRAALEHPDHSEQSYMVCVTSDMHELAEWLNTMYEDSKEQIAALEQPQNHVPDAGNMVPAGWKLVPVELTKEMLAAACRDGADLNGRPVWKHTVDVQAAWRWGQMLAAAPQPPTVKDSLTVEQQQVEQPAMTPIAQRKLDSLLASGYKISGYSIYHEQKHQHGFVTGAGLVGWWKPEGMEYPQPRGEQDWQASAAYDMIDRYLRNNLHDDDYSEYSAALDSIYTHPQPKREPLTDEQIADIVIDMNGNEPTALFWRDLARAIEVAHNIK